MDFSAAGWWWLVAGALVLLELVTGTFYLLMLALGAVAAALAAHVGASLSGQLIAAAVVGGGATIAWHLKRGARHDAGARVTQRDLSLDIGERIDVARWNADGTAQVHFRGSTWQARFDGGGTPAPGTHVIVALDGNRLMLRPG